MSEELTMRVSMEKVELLGRLRAAVGELRIANGYTDAVYRQANNSAVQDVLDLIDKIEAEIGQVTDSPMPSDKPVEDI